MMPPPPVLGKIGCSTGQEAKSSSAQAPDVAAQRSTAMTSTIGRCAGDGIAFSPDLGSDELRAAKRKVSRNRSAKGRRIVGEEHMSRWRLIALIFAVLLAWPTATRA